MNAGKRANNFSSYSNLPTESTQSSDEKSNTRRKTKRRIEVQSVDGHTFLESSEEKETIFHAKNSQPKASPQSPPQESPQESFEDTAPLISMVDQAVPLTIPTILRPCHEPIM